MRTSLLLLFLNAKFVYDPQQTTLKHYKTILFFANNYVLGCKL